ncbi:hypothetical protein BN946_scf184777.g15 [Trametes cinnabarina]|uniref:C2H2-type domain-containing protein n=1 Tax=Pycnoporus cinnabarinus TaxID=5643 RepID=A0A060S3T9_PYCCI|nr:hypothetical protein BN946_scf184777.g15 [Trametes cinnabarina]
MPCVIKSTFQLPEVPSKGQCPICYKDFKRDLRRHMQSHLDLSESPYVCTFPDCGRRFRQESNLKTHMTTHTRERPKYCPDYWKDEFGNISPCAACFRDGSMLLRHRKLNHGYKPKSKQPSDVRELSAEKQALQAEAYALAFKMNITVGNAYKIMGAKPVRAQTIRAARRAAKKPASRSLKASSRSNAVSTTPSSSGSSSPAYSAPVPSLTSSGSSSPALSPALSTPVVLEFPAEIADFFSAPSVEQAATSMSWDASPATDPSTYTFPGAVLPQSPHCNLAFSLPQASAAQLHGNHDQPQFQNFVDVVGQSDMLVPSQVPVQFFGEAQGCSFPVDNWGVQDASFGFLEPAMDMSLDLDMNMGLEPYPEVPALVSFDLPSGPFEEPLVPQPSVWATYFIAPTPSSTAASPQSLNEPAFDEFLRGCSA